MAVQYQEPSLEESGRRLRQAVLTIRYPVAPDENFCGSRPGPEDVPHYHCTRSKGHEGPHVGHNVEGVALGTWQHGYDSGDSHG